MLTAGIALDGSFDDGAGDWAVAARRGNMDQYFDLVDSPLGEPKYHDFYGHAGRRVNDWFAISANALVFDDRIRAFDSDQEEEAVAEYRDQYYWLRMDLGAPDGLGGRVLVVAYGDRQRALRHRGPSRRRERRADGRAQLHDQLRCRPTAGGGSARIRCCRPAPSGGSRAGATTIRTTSNSSCCS